VAAAVDLRYQRKVVVADNLNCMCQRKRPVVEGVEAQMRQLMMEGVPELVAGLMQ